MAPLCTICLDDEAPIQFECGTATCEYMLCGGCLEDAFNDFSGNNNKICQLCKRPSAISMAEARIGKGGVKAVQRELRETVEVELRQEQGLYEACKKNAEETNEEALRLFNSISEKLNLTCPRCKMAFSDYSGCNALTCANDTCNCKFCAICLKDCGADAHSHVRQAHGNLFDRNMFEETTKERSRYIIETFLKELESESKPFELRQLVKNHLERAGHLSQADGSSGVSYKASRFIQEATRDLEQVIASDRRSILVDRQGGRFGRDTITKDSISPRAVIPESIRVWLRQDNEDFEIVVQADIEGELVTADSPEQVKEWIKHGLIPSSGSLATLKQSLGCAIIAIENFRTLYQVRRITNKEGSSGVKLNFSSIDKQGNIEEERNRFEYHETRMLRVLAINPNSRYLSLQKHIDENVTKEKLPLALKHFIGVGKPHPVFFQLTSTVPETLNKLNEDQLKAGHPLYLKSAGEVAGPPGTGKTKTISELVRALLRCTDQDIIVLSERNGAIDAISEKFASLCTTFVNKNRKVADIAMWNDIMTFGSVDAMGENTKIFLLSEKIKYHPLVLEARRHEELHKDHYQKHAKKMLGSVADGIKEYAEKFNDDRAWNQQTRLRDSQDDDLKSAHLIVSAVERAMDDAKTLLGQKVSENSLDNFVDKHSALVLGLFPFDYSKTDTIKRLEDLIDRFVRLLQSALFDQEAIDLVDKNYMEAQQAREAVVERVKEQLAGCPRLKMSTIGSSHKLFECSKGETEDDIAVALENLHVNEVSQQDGVIVIFDESGCIPSFELLGLSRLGCPIAAILAVGDQKQLPPYNPTNQNKRRNTRGRSSLDNESGLNSLLDVSQIIDKVALRTQYRVPRDIANILDARVYSGNYRTHPRCTVSDQGLNFHHVPQSRRQERRKYQNSDEVDTVLQLSRQAMRDCHGETIMILTPYKNQQREIQFQLKRNPISGLDENCILTIDQCQGQEADLVLFTLVQRPTRFLNKNRLNVAMSRTRKKLVIIGDRHEFREASINEEWDCHFMAQDILSKTRSGLI